MRYKGEKAKAWEAVRRYVKTVEKNCYTCPARNLEGQNAQAGHFKPVAIVGSNNIWSWERDFIHLQCGRCNGAGQGMAVEYRAHLVRQYGEERVQKFEKSYRKVAPVTSWQEIIDHYVKDTIEANSRRSRKGWASFSLV